MDEQRERFDDVPPRRPSGGRSAIVRAAFVRLADAAFEQPARGQWVAVDVVRDVAERIPERVVELS